MRTDTRIRQTGVTAVAPRVLLCASVVLLLAWGRPVEAAPQDAGDPATTVDVGFDMGLPGDNVSLAIQLAVPDGVAVASTVNAITFPTRLLSFEAARVAPGVEADVTALVKPDTERADHAIVEITVAARAGTTLSNGLLASAVFKIAEGAQAAEPLKLRNVARASSAGAPSAPIDRVAGKDGEVEIIGTGPGTGDIPAVIACFFYMH